MEREFQNKVQNNSEYKHLLQDFNRLYKELDDVALARAYWTEVVYRNVELLRATTKLYQFAEQIKKHPESFEKDRDNFVKSMKGFYKNYNAKVDRDVFENLIALYGRNVPTKYLTGKLKTMNYSELTNDVYGKSKITSYKGLESLLSGSKKKY